LQRFGALLFGVPENSFDGAAEFHVKEP